MSQTREAASSFTPEEMMVVEAARRIRDGTICFVGIGFPILAANLARLTTAPTSVLVFESGTMGAKPTKPPLSIADSELAATADFIVSMPEIFTYWLQNRKIDLGFLGAAQVDRRGNLNSTVIGAYDGPSVRLPGGGGAPEIASGCAETFVMVKHSPRVFVNALDFRTTVGGGDGRGSRTQLGLPGQGVTAVFTDLGVLEPDPDGELTLVARHPGATVEEIRAATGWGLRVGEEVSVTSPPTRAELGVLRAMQEAGSARRVFTARQAWNQRIDDRIGDR